MPGAQRHRPDRLRREQRAASLAVPHAVRGRRCPPHRPFPWRQVLPRRYRPVQVLPEPGPRTVHAALLLDPGPARRHGVARRRPALRLLAALAGRAPPHRQALPALPPVLWRPARHPRRASVCLRHFRRNCVLPHLAWPPRLNVRGRHVLRRGDCGPVQARHGHRRRRFPLARPALQRREATRARPGPRLPWPRGRHRRPNRHHLDQPPPRPPVRRWTHPLRVHVRLQGPGERHRQARLRRPGHPWRQSLPAAPQARPECSAEVIIIICRH
jgi:hypothetical protein